MHTALKAYRKAVLTLEAALVLPVFMMCLLTLASLLLMNCTGLRLQALLQTQAQDMAMEYADGGSMRVSDVRERISASVSDGDARFIENGRDGIDISASNTDDPEYIDLCMRCDLVPLSDMFGMLRIPFKRKCLVHVWNGYDHGFFTDGDIVYITDEGDVYHLDRQCSHIMLTIEETEPETVKNMRNADGGRYRSCGICHAKMTDRKLYVTPEGDRYHNSITCSGLKRTVRAVRLSEVKGRRPCKRCGR